MRMILLAVTVLFVVGCVANQQVQTVQGGEEDMSCDELLAEIREMNRLYEEVTSDSALTGAVAFGVIGAVVDSERIRNNQNSVDRRTQYLNEIYSRKCGEPE